MIAGVNGPGETYTAQDAHDNQNDGADDSCRETLLGAEAVGDESRARVVIVDGKACGDRISMAYSRTVDESGFKIRDN